MLKTVNDWRSASTFETPLIYEDTMALFSRDRIVKCLIYQNPDKFDAGNRTSIVGPINQVLVNPNIIYISPKCTVYVNTDGLSQVYIALHSPGEYFPNTQELFVSEGSFISLDLDTVNHTHHKLMTDVYGYNGRKVTTIHLRDDDE